MLEFPQLSPWIDTQSFVTSDDRYWHSLALEQAEHRSETVPHLRDFVHSAHEDARRHLRRLAHVSLDPFGAVVGPDPCFGYPEMLHEITLQGYLGEILAGVFVEERGTAGISGWHVPAFMFRFHEAAFDQLELWRQDSSHVPTRIPGQTGNDCLGFLLDEGGRVSRIVVCEAKCTKTHDARLIAKAHEGVSAATQRPVSLRNLIEILEERAGADDIRWADRLRDLWLTNELPDGYERLDLVMYVHGQEPVRNDTWIDRTTAHPDYSGDRKLHVVEFRLSDIAGLLSELYETPYASN